MQLSSFAKIVLKLFRGDKMLHGKLQRWLPFEAILYLFKKMPNVYQRLFHKYTAKLNIYSPSLKQ